jgi:hypothetical protein
MLHVLTLAAAEGTAASSKTPFYLCGGLLVLWALALAAMGLRRPDFPGAVAIERRLIAVTVVLVAAAMATAVITA